MTLDEAMVEVLRAVVRTELDAFAAKLKPAPTPLPLVYLLSIEQTAKLLKVKPETVRGWCLSGRLVGRKAGHRWVVRREDLERFMTERATVRPLSSAGLTDHLMRKIRAVGGRR